MRLPRRTRPTLAALALGLSATSARAADQVAEKSPAVAPATPKVVDKASVGKGASDAKADGHKDAPKDGKGASDVKGKTVKGAPTKDGKATGKGGSDANRGGHKDSKSDKGAVGKGGSDVKA